MHKLRSTFLIALSSISLFTVACSDERSTGAKDTGARPGTSSPGSPGGAGSDTNKNAPSKPGGTGTPDSSKGTK